MRIVLIGLVAFIAVIPAYALALLASVDVGLGGLAITAALVIAAFGRPR
jgi:hypothetical protein